MVYLLLSLLYRMRLLGLVPFAHLTCRSRFVICREEAVLVMSLLGLVLCYRAVTRRRAKAPAPAVLSAVSRQRSQALETKTAARRAASEFMYVGEVGRMRHGALPVSPARSNVSPQDGRGGTEVTGWTRQNGWRRDWPRRREAK